MAGPVRISILADGSGANRAFASVGASAGGMGVRVGRAGKLAGVAVLAGLGVAGYAAKKFADASVDAASKAQQSMGATEAIYGKSAGQVVKASKHAAVEVGLSANSYRESSNLLGALLKNQGVAQDQLAGKTGKLVRLGADLSAMYGGTATEAVEGLTSAFKGEFDPLERYGISIKQSTVNTEAAAIAKQRYGKSLTDLNAVQQKSIQNQATTALLMRQSSDAQGGFARETDTLAHQQQVLGAQWENLEAIAGRALTPALTSLGSSLSQDVLPPLTRLAKQYAPAAGRELKSLTKAIGPNVRDAIRDVPELIESLRSGGGSNGDFRKTGEDLGVIADGVRDASAALPSFNDYLSVSGTVIGFAADHVDTLAKAMPFLVGGFVAYKTAQLVNQTVGRDSLVGFGLQLAATRSLTVANRQLAVAVGEVSAAQGGMLGPTGAAARETSRLGGAARLAGGAAGLGALTLGATTSNDALSSLSTIGGGALLGFSVGGPWGAAIGGGAGALLALAQSGDRAKDSMKEAAPPAADYAATLDEVSGAATRATRSTALLDLQQRGALEVGNQLGLSNRDLVGAVLGQEDALKRVNAVLQETSTVSNVTVDAWGNVTALVTGGASPAAQKLGKILGTVTGNLAEQTAETRDTARAVGRLSDVYKGVPPQVLTRIKQLGGDVSLNQLRAISRQINLTPKTIRIIARQNNIELTRKQIQGLSDQAQKVGNTKVDMAPALRSVTQFAAQAKRSAIDGATGVSDELRKGTGKAKADLSGFNTTLSNGIGTAKSAASSGGRQTGNALGQGMYAGVDAWSGPIASRAAAIVNAAVVAAKRAGEIRSPSGVMRDQVGMQLGAGIAVGLERSKPVVKQASYGIIAALVAGLSGTETSNPADSAINDIVSGIETLYDKRLDRATGAIGRKFDQLGDQVEAKFAANEKRLRKQLKGKAEEKAVRRNDAREDRAEKALQKGQQLAESKLTKQNAAARKAALALVKQMTPALRANAAAQEKIKQQIEDAESAMTDLVQKSDDYAASVKSAIVSSGSLSTLGQGDGFGSVAQLVANRTAAVAKAGEFANIIEQLRGKLNDADLQDLISQGVEGGFGTAQAILNGGPAVVQQMNDLAAQLDATGVTLGTDVASTLYGAGIKSAQGLIDGLKWQAWGVAAAGQTLATTLDTQLANATAATATKNKGAGKNIGKHLVAGLLDGLDGNKNAIDKAAKALGKALVDKVKEELGIASPSKVFKTIGGHVVAGLDIGLDDTYVRRSGATLAASLEKGFGTPALDAWAASGGSQARAQTLTLRLSAQEVDQLARGRSLTADTDAWASLEETPLMPAQTFSTLDVLRLEVEDDPVGLANLLPNPVGSDVRGGWGWLTPLDGTRTTGGTALLNFLGGFPKLNNYWTSEDMAIAGGQYAAATARAKKFNTGTVNSALKIRFEWVDAAGTVTLSAQSALVVLTSGITYQTLNLGAQQAPAGTVRFRLRFDMFDSAGGTTSPSGADVAFKDNTVAKAATSAALAGLAFIPPLGYTNILGPTHEISIDRDELDIGLLTATVLDANLDPATTPRLRPGRKVRVTALDPVTAQWEPLFVGKIRNAKVTYDLARTDAKRAQISLSAIDNAAKLAGVPRAAGYALIADLPKVLEGCGVPWRVNGSTGGVANGAPLVSNNPNASALDQVAITRDSERGYAWVDRVGVLQAWTPGTISTTIAATLDEDDYATLLVDYDTDRCINTVNLKYLRINLATGETVEVPYGPYKDQASIDQWDVRSADFTIQGITETPANMQAYANAVLAANGTPAVRVNELVLPISTPADVTKALLDLYDLVTVTNTNTALDVDMRVTGVEHVISTDKWLTRLKFANAGGVAPPQATPSPGPAAGADLPDAVALNFNGGWSAAAPGPTSGTSFTCKAGVLRGVASATGYNSASALIAVLLYIDGVAQNNMVLFPAITPNAHLALASVAFATPVTAGTHYVYFRQMSGLSDTGDAGTFFGVVTPT